MANRAPENLGEMDSKQRETLDRCFWKQNRERPEDGCEQR